jgi:hypothetical protein
MTDAPPLPLWVRVNVAFSDNAVGKNPTVSTQFPPCAIAVVQPETEKSAALAPDSTAEAMVTLAVPALVTVMLLELAEVPTFVETNVKLLADKVGDCSPVPVRVAV